MQIKYDEMGRFSEIKFDENDDPKAFWENWKEASIETTKICQQEATNRFKISQETSTLLVNSQMIGFNAITKL